MIALVPGAFQSCVFIIVAQRVSRAARNYCFFGYFLCISDGNDAIKTLLEIPYPSPKSSEKLFLYCPLVVQYLHLEPSYWVEHDILHSEGQQCPKKPSKLQN